MSKALIRHQKDDVAIEIEEHQDGQDIHLLRRLADTEDDWYRESTFSEKQARDVHALLGNVFLTE